MKRTLSILLLAASFTLVLSSCAKSGSTPSASEVNAVFNVALDLGGTRGTIDGDGSGAGADRCRLQIYVKQSGISNLLYDKTHAVQDFKASFTDIILMKDQTYDFLFWADNSNGNYYNSDNLYQLTLNGSYCGNDDLRDAFFAALADTTVTENLSATIYLKRPFAQLNVITDDVSAINAQLPPSVSLTDVMPDKVSLSFTAPNTLDVSTGIVSGSSVFQWESDVYTKNFKLSADSLNTLSMDYIFASEVKTLNEIAFKAKNTKPSSALQDISLSFSNIPLQRNWRTNITGSLLTNTADISVEIKPAWDGEYDEKR